MKRLLLIIIAIMAIQVGIHAQEPTTDLQVGDSVMVNPDSTHYMTGEKISPWVYTVKHAIQQVGSFFHPNGVLLKGIISWVHQSALIPENQTVAIESAKEVAEEIREQPKTEENTSVKEHTQEVVSTEVVVPVKRSSSYHRNSASRACRGTRSSCRNHRSEISTPTRLVGRIISSDNQAIAGAVITLANQGITTTTNANGEFSLTYLEATDEEVILEANGYMSDIVLVQLADGQLNNIGDILLQTDFVREAQEEVLLNLAEMDLNDDEGKSQSISSASSASQDVFNSTISFAWSNARYRGRGYEQTYEQNYIEGLSFNSAERGQFNFSAMGGLNDASRYKEVVEGIEANNFTFGSIGQATNYLQSATNYAQGWKVGLAGTNRNYKGLHALPTLAD